MYIITGDPNPASDNINECAKTAGKGLKWLCVTLAFI